MIYVHASVILESEYQNLRAEERECPRSLRNLAVPFLNPEKPVAKAIRSTQSHSHVEFDAFQILDLANSKSCRLVFSCAADCDLNLNSSYLGVYVSDTKCCGSKKIANEGKIKKSKRWWSKSQQPHFALDFFIFLGHRICSEVRHLGHRISFARMRRYVVISQLVGKFNCQVPIIASYFRLPTRGKSWCHGKL